MFDPTKYTVATAKPMPVFLMLDVSGSMDEVLDPENCRSTGETVYKDGQMWNIVEGGTTKLAVLNKAIPEMIKTFTEEENRETEFLFSVVTFGDTVELKTPPCKVSESKWADLQSDGNTSMGAALRKVKAMIEDREIIPSRAYRPTIVLVTDGAPTDDWEHAMDEFINQGRSSKCFCLAMGIGESDDSVLKRFISKTPDLAQRGGTTIPNRVFHAQDASHMYEFFKKVTMSVTQRSKSTTPNAIPTVAEDANDEESYW